MERTGAVFYALMEYRLNIRVRLDFTRKWIGRIGFSYRFFISSPYLAQWLGPSSLFSIFLADKVTDAIKLLLGDYIRIFLQIFLCLSRA
jgi:hypothetical protein